MRVQWVAVYVSTNAFPAPVHPSQHDPFYDGRITGAGEKQRKRRKCIIKVKNACEELEKVE